MKLKDQSWYGALIVKGFREEADRILLEHSSATLGLKKYVEALVMPSHNFQKGMKLRNGLRNYFDEIEKRNAYLFYGLLGTAAPLSFSAALLTFGKREHAYAAAAGAAAYLLGTIVKGAQTHLRARAIAREIKEDFGEGVIRREIYEDLNSRLSNISGKLDISLNGAEPPK